jgi:hypothetical protein
MRSSQLSVRSQDSIANARRQGRPRLASARPQLVISVGLSIVFVVFLMLLATTTKFVDPAPAINATTTAKDRGGKIVIQSARDAASSDTLIMTPGG